MKIDLTIDGKSFKVENGCGEPGAKSEMVEDTDKIEIQAYFSQATGMIVTILVERPEGEDQKYLDCLADDITSTIRGTVTWPNMTLTLEDSGPCLWFDGESFLRTFAVTLVSPVESMPYAEIKTYTHGTQGDNQ